MLILKGKIALKRDKVKMVTNAPQNGLVMVGQRWIRIDDQFCTECIIEVTKTDGKSIYGSILQIINGAPVKDWCGTSDAKNSVCKYHFLEGQDRSANQ